jgi:hypothetical protein
MRCPLCSFSGGRGEVHGHLVEAHADAVEMWTEAASGKMRYQVECPLCGDAHEARVKPRSSDPRFLETFGREIRMVAFDMLLNHLEAAHEDGATAGVDSREPAPLRSALPFAGAGGGRGRPGAGGVPLPPGMDEPDLPPWAKGVQGLKIVQSGGGSEDER